jgi:hypothetical protein
MQFLGIALPKFPGDLWISTSSGNYGLLAPGLANVLNKDGFLDDLRKQ